MIDEERMAVLDGAKKNLMAAGFDNVVILANEGGSNGTIGIASDTKPALMRLLMASYFMDDTMADMVEEDSPGRTMWKFLLHSMLKTLVPQIRELEEAHRSENRGSKIVSFGESHEVKE